MVSKAALTEFGVACVGANADGLSAPPLDLGNDIVIAFGLSGQKSYRVSFGKSESDAAVRAAANTGDNCIKRLGDHEGRRGKDVWLDL